MEESAGWGRRGSKGDVKAEVRVLGAGGCVDKRERVGDVGRTGGVGSEGVMRGGTRSGKRGSRMKMSVLECGWGDVVVVLVASEIWGCLGRERRSSRSRV